MKLALFAILFAFTSISSFAQPIQLTDAQKISVLNASFKTLDGNVVKLADYKGKVLILDFWETWCGPCLRFMPTLDKISKAYEKDFQVLAISPGWSDEVADVKAFSKKNGYNFTHLFAPELAKELKITGIPYKIYISAEGKVIKAQMGISGNPTTDYAEVEMVIKEYKSAK